MLRQACVHSLEREKALAAALGEVVAELRLVDVSDFIAFIRTEQFGNIDNLLCSAAELFFKHGTLRFSSSAEVEARWEGAPVIALDMEFHHARIDVYFRLILEAAVAGIEITYIHFADREPTDAADTGRLIAALADARLVPIRERSEALRTF